MDSNILDVLTHFWWVLALILIVALHKVILRVFFGTIIISKNSLGIVNKKWAVFGANRNLPSGAIIALNGEAGTQADILPPGIHFGFWAGQYSVIEAPLTTIDKGMIGIVESRDGKPLSGGRVLGKTVLCNSFQDARAFLTSGGERGPQISIIPPGTYRINTALFTVKTEMATEIADNMIGIVTTKDGAPLTTGEIAGKEVTGHNMYQDPEAFITNGGHKGLQEQVILAGRYFINPLFATVETKPMTEVPIANVGVVISYVGDEGKDVTGESFKHGNLVSRGEKGVWVTPLDPGKYPINPFTHKVEVVPTANIVLNWADTKTEAHKLDANLCTITVRSSDGFTFNLDVSQIIHVPHNDAPKVIARFGTMLNLVTQVLEPTIGNYFRNAAQSSDVIQFLHNRTARQEEAKTAISVALAEYNVNAIDTLIGDITPPEALMKTLTDRKIAEQETVTYETQRLAQVTRKELQQATAMADSQPGVVAAQRNVEIRDFEAQAAIKKAEGDAKSKTINAVADAEVLITVGKAEGTKIDAVGGAEANVIKLKSVAVGQSNYATIEISRALATSGFKLVPDVVAGGSGTDGGSNSGIVNVLMARMLETSVNGKHAPADQK